MRMRFARQALALLVAGLAGPAIAQNAGVDPEAYVDQAGIWKTTSIPVCWENGAEMKTQRAWVEQAVYEHLEGKNQTVSGLRFVNESGERFGWAMCTAKSMGIRIKVVDQRPWSYVGQQWERSSDGSLKLTSKNERIPRPTLMSLNFTFVNFKCEQAHEHCIKAIAVHEFMHAVGFLHEQLRPDAPKACKEQFGHEGDFGGYQPVAGTVEYDAQSHMNYCANMYRVPIALSAGDLQALRKFYPLK